MDPSTIKAIRSVLLSEPDGIPLVKFSSSYRKLVQEPLHLDKLGFKNVEELLTNIPDVARIKVVKNEKKVFGLTNDSLLYINATAAKSEKNALNLRDSSNYNHIDKKVADLKIHMGCIPHGTTVNDIIKHFSGYSIHNIRIFQNKSTKTYAFFETNYTSAMEITNNRYLKKFKNAIIYLEIANQEKTKSEQLPKPHRLSEGDFPSSIVLQNNSQQHIPLNHNKSITLQSAPNDIRNDIVKLLKLNISNEHLNAFNGVESEQNVINVNNNNHIQMPLLTSSLKSFIRKLCDNRITLHSTTREEFWQKARRKSAMSNISFLGTVGELMIKENLYPDDFPVQMLPRVLSIIQPIKIKLAKQECLPKNMVIFVTAIEANKTYFWAIIFDPMSLDGSKNFVKLHSQLQDLASQFLPDDYKDQKGAIFLNDVWCRVWIKVRYDDMVVVFLIDYGLTRLVSCHDLYQIPEELWVFHPMALPFKSHDNQDMSLFLNKCIMASCFSKNLLPEIRIEEEIILV